MSELAYFARDMTVLTEMIAGSAQDRSEIVNLCDLHLDGPMLEMLGLWPVTGAGAGVTDDYRIARLVHKSVDRRDHAFLTALWPHIRPKDLSWFLAGATYLGNGPGLHFLVYELFDRRHHPPPKSQSSCDPLLFSATRDNT